MSFKRKKIICAIFILAVFLICLRLALPYIGKYYINKSLSNSLEQYTGHIDDLSVSLITGSYTVHNLFIQKRSAKDNRPFVLAKTLEINLSWKMLVRRRIVLDLYGKDLEVNFVDSKDKSKSQAGVESKENWTEALKAVVPLSIEYLELKRSVINFENLDLKGAEKANIKVSKLVVRNLIEPERSKTGLSSLTLRSKLNDSADMDLDGGIDITKTNYQMNLDFALRDYDLKQSNKLFRHYVPIDLTKGKITILSEIKGSTQDAKGYLRVYLNDLKILKPTQDYKSFRHFVFEWIGGFGNWILDVITENQIATEIPFEINKGKTNFETNKAFWGALKNASKELPEEFKNL